MHATPTVPIYFRIPIDLRKRLETASKPNGYAPRGALADTAIKALELGLKSLAAEQTEQLDMFAPKPLRKHARGTVKRKPRKLVKRSKRTKRGRK
jgi:hypothetical protein